MKLVETQATRFVTFNSGIRIQLSVDSRVERVPRGSLSVHQTHEKTLTTSMNS